VGARYRVDYGLNNRIADVVIRFRLRLAGSGDRRVNESAFEAGKPPLRANAQGWLGTGSGGDVGFLEELLDSWNFMLDLTDFFGADDDAVGGAETVTFSASFACAIYPAIEIQHRVGVLVQRNGCSLIDLDIIVRYRTYRERGSNGAEGDSALRVDFEPPGTFAEVKYAVGNPCIR